MKAIQENKVKGLCDAGFCALYIYSIADIAGIFLTGKFISASLHRYTCLVHLCVIWPVLICGSLIARNLFTSTENWVKHRKGCKIFVKDVVIKIPTLMLPCWAPSRMQNMNAIGSLSLGVYVCMPVCVDGGYFICVASSQGNNLNFSLLLLKWNQLWMFYKWGFLYCAGSLLPDVRLCAHTHAHSRYELV